MKLLMISGDRSILCGKRGAFWYTLQELRKHWDRIDVICPRTRCLTPPTSLSHATPHTPGEGRGQQTAAMPPVSNGGDVHFHPSPHGLWYQPWWILREGRKLIAQHHHDVMTVHEFPPFYNGCGATKLARETKIPFALEVHHVVGYPRVASPAEWVGRILSRFVLPRHARFASAVRVVNQATKELLARWGIPAEKMAIVSSFYLDRSVLQKDVRPPISYDVSFCGRIVPNKQLMTLIEAVADIPEVRLLVIGDGPERQRCERRARELQMGHRATFLGWLPALEDVVGAVMTARMFVMNSLSEGGPRTALEAMGMGMPVITTPVGVMPEVIEDQVNGLLTDGSRGDLRRKIMRLLQDEALRDRLGKEARKVLDRFDRPTLIRQYAEFLKSVVSVPSV